MPEVTAKTDSQLAHLQGGLADDYECWRDEQAPHEEKVDRYVPYLQNCQVKQISRPAQEVPDGSCSPQKSHSYEANARRMENVKCFWPPV
jgi:hypothetical protein